MKKAILVSGSHQYFAEEGNDLIVEGNIGKKGDKVSFDRVLLIIDDRKTSVGVPCVEKSNVIGTVSGQFKGDKVRVARFRAKSRYRRVKGFRPELTKVKIEKIEG